MVNLMNAARRVVPARYRRDVRHWLDRVNVWWDRATDRPLRPPPDDLVQGIGGGWTIGETFLRHFRELCDLQPDEAVLDVGCGVGRMAVPLAGYLSRDGRYEGFDIVRDNVRWCRRAITPRWPHFRFQHANIYNREYNPRGRERGHEFRFPYPDATFDFAFLTSVFTHLMPAEAGHYLRELSRVLKPGGRCLATFFLLNDESNALVDAGRGRFNLELAQGVYRVGNPAIPEECIALDERFVEAAVRDAGLTLATPVRYGSWCGRERSFDYQDIVILRKPAR